MESLIGWVVVLAIIVGIKILGKALSSDQQGKNAAREKRLRRALHTAKRDREMSAAGRAGRGSDADEVQAYFESLKRRQGGPGGEAKAPARREKRVRSVFDEREPAFGGSRSAGTVTAPPEEVRAEERAEEVRVSPGRAVRRAAQPTPFEEILFPGLAEMRQVQKRAEEAESLQVELAKLKEVVKRRDSQIRRFKAVLKESSSREEKLKKSVFRMGASAQAAVTATAAISGFGDRQSLRNAIIALEVLGPPRAVRPHRWPSAS